MGDSETYPANDDERWRAVLARDGRCDGAFVYAVRSTGVFCHPSCPSRRPRRPQVTFFAVPEARLGRLASLYTRPPEGGMQLSEDGPGTRFREGGVSLHSGGGGLVSTVDDYLRFAEMQRRGGALGDVRLLGPRTMRLMASNHLPGDLASMGQKVWAEVSFIGIGFGLGGWVMLDPVRAKTLGSPGDFGWGGLASTVYCCLVYTSDAAGEEDSGAIDGRRIV